MAASLLDPVIDALVGVKATGLEPKRLAEMLNMTQAEIADLAGVHRTTLTRNPRSPEVQAKLGPIATILSRASEMGGGLDRAVIWFRHQPIAAFGYKRAVDVVQDGEADHILRWLDALEDGAYA
jgi:transcriptional regulator with XRE-family HTH domain